MSFILLQIRGEETSECSGKWADICGPKMNCYKNGKGS
jgi:hypothetical protein